MMSKSNNSIRIITIIAAIAIVAGIYVQQTQKSSQTLPPLSKAIVLPNTKALSHVDFVDHNGAPFSMENLQGYWNIVFFGFTNCPDICPTTMRTLQEVKQQLNEKNKWGNYRVIMVSVDPERDTVDRLKNYVPYFDEEFIGLRGDVATTTEFAKQLGILFVKQETEDGFYQVDHSASLILINPAGEMAGVITAPHKRDEISNDLILLADHFSGDHSHPATIVGNHIASSDASQTSHMSHNEKAPSVIDSNKTISGLEISEAWIRPAPPNVNSMAGYFKLKNNSGADITLTDALSSGFGMVMIHDTVIENEVAKMQHLDKLLIPAHGEVTFAPLGKHLMLMQPKKPLSLGETTSVTLIADNGAQLTHEIEVKQPVE